MSKSAKNFEVLDSQSTYMGELTLRRRRLLQLDGLEVFEVKLNDEFLMSSLFHDVEVALSDIGLSGLNFPQLDVVVGGLGLGYTAVSALKNKKLKSLKVIEALSPVIRWHKEGLVPQGEILTQDARCELINGDFFKLAKEGFANPSQKYQAVLLDIDHTPDHFLHSSHSEFYSPSGLKGLCNQLAAGGVFALWSDGEPNREFLGNLEKVFVACQALKVEFFNPLQNKTSSSTVYRAYKS